MKKSKKLTLALAGLVGLGSGGYLGYKLFEYFVCKSVRNLKFTFPVLTVDNRLPLEEKVNLTYYAGKPSNNLQLNEYST